MKKNYALILIILLLVVAFIPTIQTIGFTGKVTLASDTDMFYETFEDGTLLKGYYLPDGLEHLAVDYNYSIGGKYCMNYSNTQLTSSPSFSYRYNYNYTSDYWSCKIKIKKLTDPYSAQHVAITLTGIGDGNMIYLQLNIPSKTIQWEGSTASILWDFDNTYLYEVFNIDREARTCDGKITNLNNISEYYEWSGIGTWAEQSGNSFRGFVFGSGAGATIIHFDDITMGEISTLESFDATDVEETTVTMSGQILDSGSPNHSAFSDSFYDYYGYLFSVGTNNDTNIWGNNLAMQTFSPTVDYNVTGTYMLLKKTGSPSGDVFIYVKECNETGKPTGEKIVETSVDVTTFTTSTAWYRILFNESIQLNAHRDNETYALIIEFANGDASNKLEWYSIWTSPSYVKGAGYNSSDGGNTWVALRGDMTPDDDYEDFKFIMFGNQSHNYQFWYDTISHNESDIIEWYDNASGLPNGYNLGNPSGEKWGMAFTIRGVGNQGDYYCNKIALPLQRVGAIGMDNFTLSIQKNISGEPNSSVLTELYVDDFSNLPESPASWEWVNFTFNNTFLLEDGESYFIQISQKGNDGYNIGTKTIKLYADAGSPKGTYDYGGGGYMFGGTWYIDWEYDYGFKIYGMKNYSIIHNVTKDASTGDTVTDTITGLTAGQVYFTRFASATRYDRYNVSSWGDENYLLTKPNAPSAVTTTGITGGVNVSWTHGAGNRNNSILVFKTDAYPTSITDGTELYNGSLDYYEHTGLSDEVTYYYSVWEYAEWSVNPILHQFSDTYTSDSITYAGSPTVTTNATTEERYSNATLHGYLDDDGGEDCTVKFFYGNNSEDYLREFYYDAGGSQLVLSDTQQQGQTFTVGTVGENKDFYLDRVEVMFEHWQGAIGNIYCSIRNTVGGLPTGSDLAIDSFDSTNYNWGWHKFRFNGTLKLSAGVMYAILIRTDGWAGHIGVDHGGIYSGGTNLRYQLGSWYIESGKDLNFKVSGWDDGNVPYNNNVTVPTLKSSGDEFSYDVTGLDAGQVYYYRAYANNSYNDSNYDWGDEMYFLTRPNDPSAITLTNITDGINISWTHGGSYNSSVLVYKTDGYPSSPTDGSVLQNSTADYYVHTGLSAGTTYYYSVWEYAEWSVNPMLSWYSLNASYANKTFYDIPEITTLNATELLNTSAQLNAYIDDDGGEACNVLFYYGNTTDNMTTEQNQQGTGTDRVYGAIWRGQVFTVGAEGDNQEFWLGSLDLKLKKVGSISGNVSLTIRNTNVDSKPSTHIYANSTIPTANLTGTATWHTFNLNESFLCQKDTEYAIVVNITGGDINNYCGWMLSVSGNPYSGGTRVDSSDSGVTWSIFSGGDFTFILYQSNHTYQFNITLPDLYETADSPYYSLTGLDVGSQYYYRSFTNNTYGNWSVDWGEEVSFWTAPNPPYNLYANITADGNLNISWTKGLNATHTIVRRGLTKPETPTEGSEVYNGTGTYVVTPSDQPYIYTLWSYANGVYSTPVNLSQWGAIIINAYDFITENALIFDVFITNRTGTETFIERHASNPLILNVSQLPTGDRVGIVISANESYSSKSEEFTGYPSDKNQTITYVVLALPPTSKQDTTVTCENTSSGHKSYPPFTLSGDVITILADEADEFDKITVDYLYNAYVDQMYYFDIYPMAIYTLNAYLIPEVTATLYQIEVKDSYAIPIKDVYCQFLTYVNKTESFEMVSNLYTSASGTATIYLVPNRLYKLILSKEGYVTEYADFRPDPEVRVISFSLNYEDSPVEPDEQLFDNIDWSIEPSEYRHTTNFTLWFNISSSDCKLEWFESYVYYYNTSTYNWDQLYYRRIADQPCGGSINYTTPDWKGKYSFVCTFKKENFSSYTFGGDDACREYWNYNQTISSAISDIPQEVFLFITICLMLAVMGFLAKFGAGALSGVAGIAVMGGMFALRSVGGATMTFAGVNMWAVFLVTAVVYFIIMFLLRGRI